MQHMPEKQKTTAQHSVAIVVDTAFGANLEKLAERVHVWVIDTPDNRAVAERMWARAGGRYSLNSGITTFQAVLNGGPEQNVAEVLATVEEHHPTCDRIEVFGAQPESVVRAEFETWGYIDLAPRPGGFVALKR
jgi:hypothetical protein